MSTNEGAPTAAAANSASGGPVPTPRPPGGVPTTVGASPGGTSSSAAVGAGLSGGGSFGAATTSVGCVTAPGLGAGFGAGGLGTKTRGGGICWASAAAAPIVHATAHAASIRVHLMPSGSVLGTNRVNIGTFYT